MLAPFWCWCWCTPENEDFPGADAGLLQTLLHTLYACRIAENSRFSMHHLRIYNFPSMKTFQNCSFFDIYFDKVGKRYDFNQIDLGGNNSSINLCASHTFLMITSGNCKAIDVSFSLKLRKELKLTSNNNVDWGEEVGNGELQGPSIGISSCDRTSSAGLEEVASALIAFRNRHINWKSECGCFNNDVQSLERTVRDDMSTASENVGASQSAKVRRAVGRLEPFWQSMASWALSEVDSDIGWGSGNDDQQKDCFEHHFRKLRLQTQNNWNWLVACANFSRLLYKKLMDDHRQHLAIRRPKSKHW